MEDLKIYDEWNEIKKKLQAKDRLEYFKERQIWWSSIGQNLGSETYGKGKTFTRPVLVFKKLSGNAFLGLPMTTKAKFGSWYVTIRHKEKRLRLFCIRQGFMIKRGWLTVLAKLTIPILKK